MIDVPLALKYRPTNLSEVIGQEVVVQSLTNAFKTKTLHHAYIFGGKYGCGKTSVARILAAMENNDKGPSLTPDPDAKNVKDILSGKSIDVKEIDAASNRSIDNIRALKEEIRYSPVECRMKYVILDECHSLTGQAAEAALKMIEEPPKHVRFILATTETHSLIKTIHSRCITLKFNKVSWMLMYENLKKIADNEGIEYEENALKIAARSADGSVRNSIQNLQTLINFAGGEKITSDGAQKCLGAIDNSLYFHLIGSIIDTDVPKAMQTVDRLMRDGKQADQVLDGLQNHMRNLMIIKTCPSNFASFGYGEDETKRYEHQASNCGLELVLNMIDELVNVNYAITYNLDPQMVLEEFIIKGIISHKKISAKKRS